MDDASVCFSLRIVGFGAGPQIVSFRFRMTRLSHLTLRNGLIALHDLLATAAAVIAAFYLRFEGGEGSSSVCRRCSISCSISYPSARQSYSSAT